MEKLNIAELLKDCPKGMELDCTVFENLTFEEIDEVNSRILCNIQGNNSKLGVSFNKFGCYSELNQAKCVIFPKGKTTWEGFHRPFKDGDILFYKHKSNNVKYTFIYKRRIDMHYLLQYCGWFSEKPYLSEQFNAKERMPLYENDDIKFATEEEKQKLFQAIKDNGYKWNAETKTLEKLPKFKVGDRIVERNPISNSWIVASVSSKYYGLKLPNGSESIGVLPVSDQDNWELVPNVEPIFKVGDKIKLKGEELFWVIKSIKDEWYICTNNSKICISEQHHYELASKKFNVDSLMPFESKVLVRIGNSDIWEGDIFVRYDRNATVNKFHCIGGWFEKCIPFKGNEWLLGTTDDCNDYYKTWEN